MQGKEKRMIPRALSAGLCLLMLITLMMGVSGCRFQSSEQRVAPKMLKYMEEKYGEEFVLAEGNFMSSNFAGTEVSLWLNPVAHPEWNVTVNYVPGEPFSDNYVGFLKMDEVHDYLKPFFDEVYGAECRLFVRNPSNAALPNDFTPNTDIETFLAHVDVGLTVYTDKDVITRDMDAEKLWTLEAMRTYSFSLRIYYFSQNEFDNEVTQENRNYRELPYLYFADISLARNRGEYKPVSWSAGETPEETEN